LLLASISWGSASSERAAEQWIGPGVDGPSVWRLAQELPRDAKVYAPFDVSGLVLWLGAPRDPPVFYDARNDCYPREVAAAAFALEGPEARRSAATVLDRWGTEFALVPESHPVFAALSASDSWSTWRRDGRWIVLRRDHRP